MHEYITYSCHNVHVPIQVPYAKTDGQIKQVHMENLHVPEVFKFLGLKLTKDLSSSQQLHDDKCAFADVANARWPNQQLPCV